MPYAYACAKSVMLILQIKLSTGWPSYLCLRRNQNTNSNWSDEQLNTYRTYQKEFREIMI